MALSSSLIAEKAAILLVDETNVRWTIPEIAKWINAGCRELVLQKPTALTANVAMQLAAGTKQSLAGAVFYETTGGLMTTVAPIQLIEVVRNLGTTGTEAEAGDAITGIDRKILDVSLPSWHASGSVGTIKHFMFDAKDPKTFYVYPRATAEMYVEVIVSRSPVNGFGDSSPGLGFNDIDAGIDEIYESALIDYVLYRAYSKDAEYTANAARSEQHHSAFREALGVKLSNEVGLAPKRMFMSQRSVAPADTQG